MFNALSTLKARMFRSPELPAGAEFTLAASIGIPDEDTRWRVSAIRLLRGIPHALIEQKATGETKTVAVSALLSDPSFQFLSPA